MVCTMMMAPLREIESEGENIQHLHFPFPPATTCTSSVVLMGRFPFQAVTTVTILLFTSCPHVSAREIYVKEIPNAVNVPGHEDGNIGHPSSSNTQKTNFGESFGNARKWTTKLCEEDSDGDGVPNGAELGDPCCVWKSSADDKELITEGISHPGDKDKTTTNPKLINPQCDGVPTRAPDTTGTIPPHNDFEDDSESDYIPNDGESKTFPSTRVVFSCAIQVLVLGYFQIIA